MSAADSAPGFTLALAAESARKSRVCWLSWSGPPASGRPRLVWHVWYDGALVVLSGDADQVLPGLEESSTAEVTTRSKDTGGRLLTWTGAVEVVDPGSASWDQHAAALLGVRLNLPDQPAALERWRATGTVVRIAPVGATQDRADGPLP